jgi:hypothetical protein
MTIAAQAIVLRTVNILQDTSLIRWAANELVRWLNDGQREVIVYRPDAISTTATMTLAAGTRQSLGSAGLTLPPVKLIEVTRNLAASSTKLAVRLVPRAILDSHVPGWHTVTGSVNVENYVFDPRDPKTFYVYPPATSSAQLEVVYGAYPTDITEPADGAAYTTITGNISLPDSYSNCLLDYILYRAYTKDSEYAGNAQRAQMHYGAFTAALVAEVKATLAVQPQMSPGVGPTTA